jgi:hypothetical protein
VGVVRSDPARASGTLVLAKVPRMAPFSQADQHVPMRLLAFCWKMRNKYADPISCLILPDRIHAKRQADGKPNSWPRSNRKGRACGRAECAVHQQYLRGPDPYYYAGFYVARLLPR